MNDAIAWVQFILLPAVGAIRPRAVIEHFGRVDIRINGVCVHRPSES